jgi:prephenate dehydratase
MLPRVGFLGPAGTFTEEALLSSAAADAVEPVAFATIYDTVVAVRRQEVQWAVAPIENSLDGSVTVTLDLLAETGTDERETCSAEAGGRSPLASIPVSASTPESASVAGACQPAAGEEHGDLEIVGEALLAVKHSLITAQRVAISEIDTVFSHPQVPGQCTRLLRGELAHARVLPASSTAEAVRMVATGGVRGQAALGTRLAADIYGATVVREGVQDHDDNVTRFVWLAATGKADGPPLRTGMSPPLGRWKTSVVFWGSGADSPGWLARCLDVFATRGINLTKIESRPQRARMGHYMFFVDLQGSARDPIVAEALAGLRAVSEQVRVLGSYPAAADPSRPTER